MEVLQLHVSGPKNRGNKRSGEPLSEAQQGIRGQAAVIRALLPVIIDGSPPSSPPTPPIMGERVDGSAF